MALASIYHLGTARCSATGRPVSSSHYCPSLCWRRSDYWPSTFCYIAIPQDGKEEHFSEVCLAFLRVCFRVISLDWCLWHASWCETSILWSYSQCPDRLCPNCFWRPAL